MIIGSRIAIRTKDLEGNLSETEGVVIDKATLVVNGSQDTLISKDHYIVQFDDNSIAPIDPSTIIRIVSTYSKKELESTLYYVLQRINNIGGLNKVIKDIDEREECPLKISDVNFGRKTIKLERKSNGN